MAYDLEIKRRAIELRKKGYSIKEVASCIGVAKSTSSIWLSDIILDEKAKNRLRKRNLIGQYNARKTRESKRLVFEQELDKKASFILSKINLNDSTRKLLCALLFWAEGSKDTSRISFINSDPVMIKSFITLLRSSFDVKENKFRGLVHIHEYHNDSHVKIFWSKVSGIPLSQFSKSYRKPHSKKRKRANYMGSFRINYYDFQVAKELRSIYNTFAKEINRRGVG